MMLAALLLGVSLVPTSAVWVVDETAGPGVDFTVLQDAIDAAADGDTILVKPGIYA